MPIHRTIKNVVKNYTHAEVKVREATSNDPWGPPSMVMAEIAQMSHDLLAFSEIMPMIWKRLNDHGKNWRHVYKSLILLDYLVKAGSERVVQYCMENIISIQTLKDFQHFEDGVDHGLNIREKAKQLVALLKDTDKLRNERSRATNVKNRFGVSTGYALTDNELRSSSPPAVSNFSSSTERRHIPSYATESPAPPIHASSRPAADSEMESVRPSTTNEEDLQLQLALAMSKEEHDEEIKKRKGDEIKLQMAIEESKKTAQQENSRRRQMTSVVAAGPPLPRQQTAQSQPWDWEAGNVMADSWSAPLEPRKDPWSSGGAARTSRDPTREFNHNSSLAVYAEIQKNFKPEPAPWEEVAVKYSAVETNFSHPPVPHDDFVQLRAQPVGAEKKQNIEKWLDSNLTAEDSDDNLWDINEVDGTANAADDKKAKSAKKVTPEEFLGPNAKLVDFDDLVSKPVTTSAVNPFAMTINKSITVNPFVAKAQEEEKSRKVPLNQLQLSASSSSFLQTSSASLVPASGLTVTGFPPPTLAVVYPTQPIMQQQGYNPFL